jgi:hypothetical protein
VEVRVEDDVVEAKSKTVVPSMDAVRDDGEDEAPE